MILYEQSWKGNTIFSTITFRVSNYIATIKVPIGTNNWDCRNLKKQVWTLSYFYEPGKAWWKKARKKDWNVEIEIATIVHR